MDEQSSLYQRVGGESGIADLVDAFYVRVMSDAELRPFFEGVGMDKLLNMQRQLFAAALGGPVPYTARPISYAHDGLGVTPHHLQIFLEHLFETVRELGLTQRDVIEIIDRINTYADHVTHAASFGG